MEIDGQTLTVQHNGQPVINDTRPKMRPTYLPACACDTRRVLLVNGVLRCGDCYAAYGSAGSLYYTDKYLQHRVDTAPTLPGHFAELGNEKIRDAALAPSTFEGEPIPEQFIIRPEQYPIRDEDDMVPAFINGVMVKGRGR